MAITRAACAIALPMLLTGVSAGAADQTEPVSGGWSTTAAAANPDEEVNSGWKTTYFLRRDMPDISLFSGIKSADKAKGAEISYARDEVSHDTIWAVNGIAGVALQLYGAEPPTAAEPTLIAVFAAPYVSMNRTSNSSPKFKNKDVDTATYGVKVETGYANLAGGSQFFRIGGAGVEDGIRDATAVSILAEWLPVYPIFEQIIPGTLLRYTFQPDLKLQYDRTTDAKKPLLFSMDAEALRIGPQFSLALQAVPHANWFLSKFVVNVTYHPAYELYSGRSLSWFDASITYNLDPNGHFGITTSYSKGDSEDTGKATDIAKIALTGKF
jgi:hypothetical protein